MISKAPSIFSYNNFREFLRDYYELQKNEKTGFTYARFSEAAGIRSQNYFKLVMDGKKKLTPRNMIKFSLALDFDDTEKDYFDALVHFNQTTTAAEKDYFYGKIKRIRDVRGGVVDQRVLKEYEFEAISSWTHHSVMLLTNLDSFRESPRWISKKLYGLVGEAEASTILTRLESIGLLVRDSNGRLRQSSKRIQTKPEISREASRVFYEGILLRAVKSLSLDDSSEREFGAYMVGLSPAKLPELKRRVRDFLNGLNEWALETESPEQIYAFLFNGFPLSTLNQDEKWWS